ncbi:MAG: glycosyltransferase family 39 protein [Cytophagales bacterium]|nr:glycosyltransferase family 39 protein [Cytophagales bacterium]
MADSLYSGIVKFFVIVLFIYSSNLYYSRIKVGFNNTICDQHGFRQTQTAITSYYFNKNGIDLIGYETPIMGYPWKMPLEFPIMQAVASWVSKVYDIKLDNAGRITGIAFHILSGVVLYIIFVLLLGDYILPLIGPSILFINPLLTFWSRSFLIETTANFLCLCFLLLMYLWLNKNNIIYFIIALFVGLFGMLTKPTTGVLYLAALGLYSLYHLYMAYTKQKKIEKSMIFQVCFLAIAYLSLLGITLLWTKYSDEIKSVNYLSQMNMSSNLKDWNFGTFDQKINIDSWLYASEHHFFHYNFAVIPIAILSLFFNTKNKIFICIFSVCYWLGPLIFTNLYYVHNYYSSASTPFFCFCFGLFIADMASRKNLVIVILMVTITLAYSYHGQNIYRKYHQYSTKNNNIYPKLVGIHIQSYTAPDEVLLVWGAEFSSEIPYYSERRCVMMPVERITKILKDSSKYDELVKVIQLSKPTKFIMNNYPNVLYHKEEFVIINKLFKEFEIKENFINDHTLYNVGIMEIGKKWK